MIVPINVDGFTFETLGILTDDELAKQMAERGTIRSQQFSWEKCARDTLKIYEAASR
jgi:alpha-1,3-rhamnosyl/mannosyltransferase